jgi:hypothetical protein
VQERSGVPTPPVALGDRVRTPYFTSGVIESVRWIAPGPCPLVATRHVPGHWLALVFEDGGVGRLPYDASHLRREGVTAPHLTA